MPALAPAFLHVILLHFGCRLLPFSSSLSSLRSRQKAMPSWWHSNTPSMPSIGLSTYRYTFTHTLHHQHTLVHAFKDIYTHTHTHTHTHACINSPNIHTYSQLIQFRMLTCALLTCQLSSWTCCVQSGQRRCTGTPTAPYNTPKTRRPFSTAGCACAWACTLVRGTVCVCERERESVCVCVNRSGLISAMARHAQV